MPQQNLVAMNSRQSIEDTWNCWCLRETTRRVLAGKRMGHFICTHCGRSRDECTGIIAYAFAKMGFELAQNLNEAIQRVTVSSDPEILVSAMQRLPYLIQTYWSYGAGEQMSFQRTVTDQARRMATEEIPDSGESRPTYAKEAPSPPPVSLMPETIIAGKASASTPPAIATTTVAPGSVPAPGRWPQDE